MWGDSGVTSFFNLEGVAKFSAARRALYGETLPPPVFGAEAFTLTMLALRPSRILYGLELSDVGKSGGGPPGIGPWLASSSVIPGSIGWRRPKCRAGFGP